MNSVKILFVLLQLTIVATTLDTVHSQSSCRADQDKIGIIIRFDRYAEETDWVLTDWTSGDTLASGGPYSNEELSLVTNVCVSKTSCVVFTIRDTKNNGICCDFSEGSYQVTWNDAVIKKSGLFASSETTKIGTTCPTNLPISNDSSSYVFQEKESLVVAVNEWRTNVTGATRKYGIIQNWNVSLITDLSGLFNCYYDFNADCINYNSDISTWDTSRVTTMRNMFYRSLGFNGDLSAWDTSRVLDMSGMFASTNLLNRQLSRWNTSRVTDMKSMFRSALQFNQDIASWDTSKVKDMSSMFQSAAVFNRDISAWKTTQVTNMKYMFQFATAFNSNILSWDTSNVTSMTYMFYGSTWFNSIISTWDTSNVNDMSYMFYQASLFNQNISEWNTSQVSNMSYMFYQASAFNQTLCWNTFKAKKTNMFVNSNGNLLYPGCVANWITSKPTMTPSTMVTRKPTIKITQTPSSRPTLSFNVSFLTISPTLMPSRIPTRSTNHLSNSPFLWKTIAPTKTQMHEWTETRGPTLELSKITAKLQVRMESVEAEMVFSVMNQFEDLVTSWLSELFRNSSIAKLEFKSRVFTSRLVDLSSSPRRNLSLHVIRSLQSASSQTQRWALVMDLAFDGKFKQSDPNVFFSDSDFTDKIVSFYHHNNATLVSMIQDKVKTKAPSYDYFSNVYLIFEYETSGRTIKVGAIVSGVLAFATALSALFVVLFLRIRNKKNIGNTTGNDSLLRKKRKETSTKYDQKVLDQGRKILLASTLSKESSSIQSIPMCYLEYITNGWNNLLGSGGFGSVYIGIDNVINISVAVKTLRSDRRSRKYQVEFEQEINHLNSIRHRHIVRIVAKCVEPGFTSMVLEFAAGGTVQSILWFRSTRELFSPMSRLYVAQCLVSAVRHLHRHNILHRDIKPENICMLHQYWYLNPHAILIDFGIATSIRDEERVGLTMTSNPGTRYFMAPEYVEKYHFDAKSDVFSIGVTLICLLTSDYSMIIEAIDCNLSNLVQHADKSGGNWPEDVLNDAVVVIHRCTAQSPSDRPTVEELFEELSRLRSRTGALDKLPVDITRSVTNHSSASRFTDPLAAFDGPRVCVLCGLSTDLGVVCANNHFTCQRDICLESVARDNMGSELIPCPGNCCSETFFLRDLFGKLNADVYGELVIAMDTMNEYKYFTEAIKRKLFSLKDLLFSTTNLKNMIASESKQVDTDLLSVQEQMDHIHSLKVVASRVGQQEEQLQFERRALENRIKHIQERNECEEIYSELANMIQCQEELKLSHAECGNEQLVQLQYPFLFVLVPLVPMSMKKSRYNIHATYRMYFLCSHDYSWVETAVVLKPSKAWFTKIAPILKRVVIILRLLSSVYDGIPYPTKMAYDIISSTGFGMDSLIEDILEHMEFLLFQLDGELDDLKQRLDTCFEPQEMMKMIHELGEAIPPEAHGVIALNAYKDGNIGWMGHMELVRNNSKEYAWIKKENVKLWKREGNTVRKWFRL